MRRDIDRKGHAGAGFAAGMFVHTLHAAMRSIQGNGFDRHGFTSPAPRRRQDCIWSIGMAAPPTDHRQWGLIQSLPDQAALDFATWVAIASISGGFRQS